MRRLRCLPTGCPDDGVASFVAVTLIGLLVLIGLAANFVVATAAAHRGAQAAADLAALAGAVTVQSGGIPCVVAAEVATANHVSVTSCHLDGDHVVLAVRSDGPQLFGHRFEVSGRARAGPVD